MNDAITYSNSESAQNASALLNEAVREHYDPVYRYARSLVFTVADAEDLVQSAFLKLHRNIDKIRERDRLRSWLIGTTRRQFIDGYRHARKFQKVPIDDFEPTQPEPSSQNGRKMDAETALEGLHQLPIEFREPISLFYLEHKSYKEIAAILEIPIGTVMSRMRRGKDHLRKWMEEGGRQAKVSVAAS